MSEYLIHRVFGYVEAFEKSLGAELVALRGLPLPSEDDIRHYRSRLSAVSEIREYMEDVMEREGCGLYCKHCGELYFETDPQSPSRGYCGTACKMEAEGE